MIEMSGHSHHTNETSRIGSTVCNDLDTKKMQDIFAYD